MVNILSAHIYRNLREMGVRRGSEVGWGSIISREVNILLKRLTLSCSIPLKTFQCDDSEDASGGYGVIVSEKYFFII